MELRVLGPIDVVVGGRFLQLGGAKQRALLALLLLNVNEVVSGDRLVHELWGGRAPKGAAITLRSYISNLRKALRSGGSRQVADLTSRSQGYVLQAPVDTVDFLRFQRLISEGHRALENGAPESASVSLNNGLALWRGAALADVAFAPFAQAHVARFEELRLTALEDRVEAELLLGRHSEMTADLERLAEEHPLRERFRGQLMLALYRSGRQAEALIAYQRGRNLLSEELGIDPTPVLQRMQQAILVHDPTLAWQPLPEPNPIDARADAHERAVPARLPTPLSRASAAAFVGRVVEQSTLSAAWARTCRGDARVLILTGVAGVGKSALAAQFAARLHGAGATVLFGRCEEEALISYQPFAEALRGYLGDWPAERLRARFGGSSAELVRLIPALIGRLADPGTPSSDRAESDRYRLFDAVVSSLRSASADAPVLLVLEDLHLADQSTALMLRHVFRHAEQCPLLVLAVVRDGELPETDPIAELFADLRREGFADTLKLSGLVEDEVRTLVRMTTGQAPEPAFLRDLFSQTGGNPFFVGEVLAHLNEAGRALTPDDLAVSGVPDGVKSMVGRRLHRLGQATESILAAGSLMGREFDSVVLAQALERSVDDVAKAADRAVEARLVSEVPAQVGHYTFAHALVQETLYGNLSALRRARLHHRIAEALEGVRSPHVDAHLPELARHFFEAGSVGHVDKAFKYSVRAGQQALASLAYEEAVVHYWRALQALDWTGSSDEATRCELLLDLADAQLRAGETASALITFREAAERAKRGRLPEHCARAALGFGSEFGFGRVTEQLIELLESAVALLGTSDSAMRALVLSRLAGALYWTDPGQWNGTQQRKIELCEQAVKLARNVGNDAMLVHVLDNNCFALWGPENLEERVELASEILELATRVQDRRMEVRGRRWRVINHAELGDFAAFDADVFAYEHLVDRLKLPIHQYWSRFWKATRALMQGRFDDAEQLSSQALALGIRAQESTVLHTYGTQLYMLRTEQGRAAELEDLLVDRVASYPEIPAWRAGLAYVYLELNRPDEARMELARLAAHRFADVPRDALWVTVLCISAEVSIGLGDRASAALIYDLLRPYERRCMVVGFALACTGSVAHYLARLACLLGRREEADRLFRLALDVNLRIGAKPYLARTQYEYGAMLHRRGGSRQERQSRMFFDQAHATATELGMTSLFERMSSGVELK